MLSIHPDEISNIIRKQIAQYSQETFVLNIGTVFQIGDGITRIYGLQKVIAGEFLEFEDGTISIALNLETKNVGVVLIGDGRRLREGRFVRATGKIAQIQVGFFFLGRIINSLSVAIDGLKDILSCETRIIERFAPGIIQRQFVHEPMQTGIISVDAIISIGRGQRELLIGDRQTGKTSVAIDTILNQIGKNVVCIYVAIEKLLLVHKL